MKIFMHLYLLLNWQFTRLLGVSAQEALTIITLTVCAWVALYMVCTIAYAIGS